MKAFIYSFKSEWLKRKRSLAAWLVVCGAFFTPSIIIVVRLFHHEGLQAASNSARFWENHWKSCWEAVAVFLLPLGAILASSLITQLEYKDNTWKLMHATPQRFATIFLAKFSVIMLMMIQFLLLFNVGIYLSGILPGLLLGISYPVEAIAFTYFIKENLYYFISCLPIIALQYLISLRFKNFLVPIGGGIILWILSIGMLSWKYAYWMPYGYCAIHFLKDKPKFLSDAPVNSFAMGYFLLFIASAYILYIQQKEKG